MPLVYPIITKLVLIKYPPTRVFGHSIRNSFQIDFYEKSIKKKFDKYFIFLRRYEIKIFLFLSHDG